MTVINNYHLLKKGHKLILLFSLLTTLIILSGCGAQAAPKVYRVGILNGLDFFSPTVDGFKAKMTELGYVEGQNISYDVQKTNVDLAEYQRVLKKFVADEVDLIFAFPTEATLEAKAATQGTNIPVIFANVVIEGVNVVESVRQPGGNITGVRFPGAELSVKRLEFLHQLAPQAKRVWVPYLKDYPIVLPELEALRPAAASLGVTLVEVPATSPADIQADLEARSALSDSGVDAILFIVEPLAVSPDALGPIIKFAAEHNVPIGGAAVTEGDQGSMFSYIPDTVEAGQLAAPLADKIFKGTPAGTIPVVSPESHLVLNYKVAQKLGLKVPEGLLSQAVEIIR
jgi:putative tryptophan/tyrosine transport system substrate-binding protein